MELLSLLGVGITVFAVTNIDDLFVLTVFFADKSVRASEVVLGQYLGILALVAISVAGSLVSLVIPAEWIALLGLVPLALGIKKLFELRSPDTKAVVSRSERSNVLAVAGVTFANGGDNIGVYTPLFASRPKWEVGVFVCVFLILVAVWCLIARLLLRHQRLGDSLRRYGHILLPLVLIGLGAWILTGAWPLVERAFRI